jgi:hypothetical protein
MTDLEYVKYIAEIAKEVEVEDSIDWGNLPIDEDDTYNFIANNVVSRFNIHGEIPREIMLATITKLVVENFTLNLKLQLGK